MNDSMDMTARDWHWARLQLALVGLVFMVALTGLLIVPLLPTGQVTYAVGDVVRDDIRSQRRLEYQSQIETEREQERAASDVEVIYDPPATRVARQQIARAQEILAYISSVRHDFYATPEQRVEAIQAITDPEIQKNLTQNTIRQILNLDDDDWAKVSVEVERVLDQAMRNSIRAEDLAAARGRVPTLVDVRRMDDEEVAIVSTLVRGLLVPNTFVNVEATEVGRQQARDGASPVVRRFEADEIVLREGDIVSDVDLEALEKLGLLQTDTSWRDVASALALVLLTMVVLGLALVRYQPNLLTGRTRNVALVSFLFIAIVVLAKFMIPGRAVLPYLFPAAALSMVVTVLLNPELAIVATVALAALVGHLAGDSLELAVYVAAGGIVASLVLRRVERVNAFFRAGVSVGLTNVAVVLVFRLPDAGTDPLGMLTLVATALLNGAVAASLTLAVFFIVGSLFDITTSLKLLELSQPSHPLLRQLLLKAPGTYHHTLLIANLAEQAAEEIGANPLLTRVGAYYHDIGKTLRPHFFTENQMDGVNPHDRLDPYTSAEILSGHVTDGLELAKRYRLPRRVQAFISEHHGDSRVSFMYQRAVDEAGGDASKVDESRFRYAGPKPQSKETALVMLADSVEAISKSKQPGSEQELDELVENAIRSKMDHDQLDDCDLTLRDVIAIRQSFVSTLKGLYHTRIVYPDPAAQASVGEPVVSETDDKRSPVGDGRFAPSDPAASFIQAFSTHEEREQQEHESVQNPD